MQKKGWRYQLTLGVFVGTLAQLASLTTAFGNQPLPEANVKIRVAIKSNQLGEIEIENQENEPAEVDVNFVRHLPQRRMSAFANVVPIIHPPVHIGVPVHQIGRQQFNFEAEKDGLMIVHFQSKVTIGRRQVNGPTVFQVYQSTPNGLREITFEQAYLTKRIQVIKPDQKSKPAEVKLGGGYTAKIQMANMAFNAHALDAAQANQIIPVRLESPLAMADKYALKHLPEIGGRTRGNSLDAEDVRDGMDLEAMSDSSAFEPREGFALERAEDVASNLNLYSSLTIKGHMSTKYFDGSFHAAWGWVVTAWQYVNIAGVNLYMPLGWAYVNGDGSWSIPMASFATPNAKVFVQYQTGNRFVHVQDPSGNVYTWGDWWNLNGNVTDIGYRFADLSANGDLPGIDKLYEGATEEWSKLYYNGLNPLRDEPIQVTYPNSLASGHCINNKDSNGKTVPNYAWSCSEWSSGRIWIIPAHGDKTVVQHEIAHSINSYFWNGNLSSGSGGPHSLTGCYNGGLALTEGFANFMAYWVQFDRGTASPMASYINYNIDTYNSDSCSSGEINEMRVASTFWDMYDTRNDGPDANHFDGWNYINQISPVAIYLKNGTQQKMSDYLPIVDAGDSAWFAADRALFRLNKIIP